MKEITNNENLPEAIYLAIKKFAQPRRYNNRTFSVTEILNPPRMVWLRRRHEDELVVDASEYVWALYGSAMHVVLENAGVENALVEERIQTTFTINGEEVTLTGCPDLYKDARVSDYKNTSVWSVIHADQKWEWDAQASIYALMLGQHSFPVSRLEIVALMRDWQKSRARGNRDYPRYPVKVIPLDLWSQQRTMEFVENRLAAILAAEPLADDDLPLCTAEDRWEKPTTFAIMKAGRKSALRVLPTLTDAQAYIQQEIRDAIEKEAGKKKPKSPPSLSIQERPGQSVRCADYCAISDYCSQWKAMAECEADVTEEAA